ncbi:MAG: hypothetical protein GY868_18170, partial [Deltaproteobacteria bacterium]|nr:hypothetical protein [Deltaproteobacteria bacterium]
MPDNDRLEQAKECAWQYLRCYLDLLDRTEKITDPGYRQKIATASLSYCDQLSEKDGSRKMLGRLIGMKKADIIFKEVIR